jgi:electron transfer flavoprotein alpha/beta subunit
MTARILVPVKRVVDANVRMRVSASGAIDTTGLKIIVAVNNLHTPGRPSHQRSQR